MSFPRHRNRLGDSDTPAPLTSRLGLFLGLPIASLKRPKSISPTPEALNR